MKAFTRTLFLASLVFAGAAQAREDWVGSDTARAALQEYFKPVTALWLSLDGSSTDGRKCHADVDLGELQLNDDFASVELTVGEGEDAPQATFVLHYMIFAKNLKVDAAAGSFEVTSVQERQGSNLFPLKRTMDLRIQKEGPSYRIHVREKYSKGLKSEKQELECVVAGG